MKKVLILFGGNSFEHEISCKSVNYIMDNIDTNIFDYNLVGIDYNNDWFEVEKTLIDKNWKNKRINKIDNIFKYIKNFDIVFPIIHGNSCEDGKLQSIFELFDIKYVGCDSFSSLICYDKLLTKYILEKHSIPQVPYIVYSKNMDYKNIEFPVIVKPCKCGSSIGISVVNNVKQLKKALKLALKYDNNIVIEKFIKKNRELECAVLENNKKLIISDIGEIINNDSWYDYNSKYENENETVISNIDNSIKEKIQIYSRNIFKIMGCKDLSRIDFIYDLDENKLYFNEINTMPGFTKISMFPKLIENTGIKPKELITILLNS